MAQKTNQSESVDNKPTKDPRLGMSFDDMLKAKLQDAEFAHHYINAALEEFFEEGDWDELMNAIHDVAKAKGIANTARIMGVSRQSLSNMLNANAKASAYRLFKLLTAMNLQLYVKPAEYEGEFAFNEPK